MNAIQMFNQVSFLNDRQRSARFPDSSYMIAINSAILAILEDRLEPIKKQKKYSFESSQRVRDELYTLIPPTLSITPSGNVIAYPAKYYYYLKLECIIDGVKTTPRPISYNESGVSILDINPFKKAANTKTYFDQNRVGFNIKRATTGTFSSADLDYIETPNTVSIGKESDKINLGASVLAIGTEYIVYEEAVSNGVTYEEGEIFTATAVSLDSGIVIPTSVIVDCNFPDKLHKEVTEMAAAIMNGSVSDFAKKQDLTNDANAT